MALETAILTIMIRKNTIEELPNSLDVNNTPIIKENISYIEIHNAGFSKENIKEVIEFLSSNITTTISNHSIIKFEK